MFSALFICSIKEEWKINLLLFYYHTTHTARTVITDFLSSYFLQITQLKRRKHVYQSSIKVYYEIFNDGEGSAKSMWTTALLSRIKNIIMDYTHCLLCNVSNLGLFGDSMESFSQFIWVTSNNLFFLSWNQWRYTKIVKDY